MSVEDRVLRLENAFATLSELAARSESRADTLSELVARSESRTDTLVQLTETLVQVAVSASERADTHETWINELGEAQAELVKAQTRTEAALAETNERLNNLINVVERFISERRNGES
jgi:ABC-type transporter Mla subunit MlaD